MPILKKKKSRSKRAFFMGVPDSGRLQQRLGQPAAHAARRGAAPPANGILPGSAGSSAVAQRRAQRRPGWSAPSAGSPAAAAGPPGISQISARASIRAMPTASRAITQDIGASCDSAMRQGTAAGFPRGRLPVRASGRSGPPPRTASAPACGWAPAARAIRALSSSGAVQQAGGAAVTGCCSPLISTAAMPSMRGRNSMHSVQAHRATSVHRAAGSSSGIMARTRQPQRGAQGQEGTATAAPTGRPWCRCTNIARCTGWMPGSAIRRGVLQVALAPAAVALQLGQQVRRLLLVAADQVGHQPDVVAGAAHQRGFDEVVRHDAARHAAGARDAVPARSGP